MVTDRFRVDDEEMETLISIKMLQQHPSTSPIITHELADKV
jgi:hypothetical protein